MKMEIKLRQFNGAVESPKDPRRVKYEDVCGAPIEIPRKYNVEEKYGKATRIDQGSSLSCVAQGGTRYKEIKDLKETGKFIQLSARFIYSLYHLPNGAMYVVSVMKCLQDEGVAEENVFPTLRPGQIITENWMRYNGDLTDEIYKNATIHKIKSYAEITTRNPEVIARAIYENDGVILGIKPVNGSMGHLIYWTGYDLDKLTFDILDSYEPQDKTITIKNNKFYWYGGSQIDVFDLMTMADVPNAILESVKDMYLLKRSPDNYKEVYALNEGIRRHIANKQTLTEGAKDKDKYWIWKEGDDIPVATDREWNCEELAEILLIPADSSVGIKVGRSLWAFIKSLFGIFGKHK